MGARAGACRAPEPPPGGPGSGIGHIKISVRGCIGHLRDEALGDVGILRHKVGPWCRFPRAPRFQLLQKDCARVDDYNYIVLARLRARLQLDCTSAMSSTLCVICCKIVVLEQLVEVPRASSAHETFQHPLQVAHTLVGRGHQPGGTASDRHPDKHQVLEWTGSC